MQHTPGPWNIAAGSETSIISIDGVLIGSASQKTGRRNHLPEKKTAKANAKLIAAAPDLLKFAQGIEVAIQATGHNLNSTATREERSRFISNIVDAWNNGGYAAIDKATE